MARMSQPKDDDECRKRITAIAVAGENLMLLDNLDRMLGNASLDAVIDRDKLDRSDSRHVGNGQWHAVIRHVVRHGQQRHYGRRYRPPCSPYSAGIVRRKPRGRTRDFRSSRLAPLGTPRAPRLAVAAVTIPAAYCSAGRPSLNLKPWGIVLRHGAIYARQLFVWTGFTRSGEQPARS